MSSIYAKQNEAIYLLWSIIKEGIKAKARYLYHWCGACIGRERILLSSTAKEGKKWREGVGTTICLLGMWGFDFSLEFT